MKMVLQNGAYTLNALGQTILLTDTSIKKENLLKIRDVDHNSLIYDSDNPVNGKNISPDPVTTGLFHFEYAGILPGSTLQITVDLPYTQIKGVDGGTP